jgi:hypothetical protein
MFGLQIAILVLLVLLIAEVLAFGLSLRASIKAFTAGPTLRARRRRSIAEAAIDYGEQIDGKRVPPLSGLEKKAHALDFCRKLDLGDNGRRDFDDGEFTREIESVLGERARLSA